MWNKFKRALGQARKPYVELSPDLTFVFKGAALTKYFAFLTAKRMVGHIDKLSKGASISEIVASELFTQAKLKTSKVVANQYAKLLLMAKEINPDDDKWYKDIPLGGPMEHKRTWFDKPGRTDVVIVFHDADNAGKHLDIHFTAYGVSVGVNLARKGIDDKIKYNNKTGKLTQSSVDTLLGVLKNDINQGKAWLFYNWDHTPEEARTQWLANEKGPEGYGSGKTRQVILDTKGAVLKIGKSSGGIAEMYIPDLNPYYKISLFKMEMDGKPIVNLNRMKIRVPKMVSKLKLKLIPHDDVAKFESLVNPEFTTLKYDGASSYFVLDIYGLRFFSPRESKVTGQRIEYTGKVPELAHHTIQEFVQKAGIKHSGKFGAKDRIVGMGELLFKDKSGKYLDVNTISGLLNTDALIPTNLSVEYRLYRVDYFMGEDTTSYSFLGNREIAEKVCNVYPQTIKLPEFTTIEESKKDGIEGVVGILKTEGANVYNGLKLKWKDESVADWKVTSVELGYGSKGKGNISGVVHFISEESGKAFKLGPGQLGTKAFCEEIMNNPDKFIGRVYKVNSLRGHEGRSAKLIGEHVDKGSV